MPYYSKQSRERLETCDIRLQDIFNTVIKFFDHSILCGHRPEEEQDLAFQKGNSKVQWPKGKHNKIPSKAVDTAPYPIEWDNIRRFTLFAGFVLGIAYMMGIKLRWGGDWNGDTKMKDQTFNDLVHFELID